MTKLNDELKQLEDNLQVELETKKQQLIIKHERLTFVPGEALQFFNNFQDFKASNSYFAFFKVDDKSEVLKIIQAYRNKSVFKAIGFYKTSCATVTAYPYDDYLKEDSKKYELNDSIIIRESAGRGFNSTNIEFYPVVESQRVKISIEFNFRKIPHDLTCHVSCNYDRYGNPIRNTIFKNPSKMANSLAARSIAFSSGSDDAMNNYHIVDASRMIEALKG